MFLMTGLVSCAKQNWKSATAIYALRAIFAEHHSHFCLPQKFSFAGVTKEDKVGRQVQYVRHNDINKTFCSAPSLFGPV